MGGTHCIEFPQKNPQPISLPYWFCVCTQRKGSADVWWICDRITATIYMFVQNIFLLYFVMWTQKFDNWKMKNMNFKLDFSKWCSSDISCRIVHSCRYYINYIYTCVINVKYAKKGDTVISLVPFRSIFLSYYILCRWPYKFEELIQDLELLTILVEDHVRSVYVFTHLIIKLHSRLMRRLLKRELT